MKKKYTDWFKIYIFLFLWLQIQAVYCTLIEEVMEILLFSQGWSWKSQEIFHVKNLCSFP